MQDSERERPASATGGCQCGAVRYAVEGSRADWDCNVCHCRMCQKASGGPFMAFVNVGRDAVRWTKGERAAFASSTIAARGFCRDCGTPLTYERTANRISLALGSFDDPTLASPTSQLTGGDVLSWGLSVADIPVEALATWAARLPVPILSHQHPDRDS